MALLKIWEGSRGIMRLLVIQFVCWLGCFSTFALAQFDISEGVTGSVTFPALGITCVSNLAVFVTTLIRGRLDLEIGARDVIEILLNPKLEEIKGIKHGYGLTNCSQGNATETATSGGGGDVGVASSEGVLQAPSTGENDVHTPSTGGGRETASTEENVPRSPTEGGGIQTILTVEDEEEKGLTNDAATMLSSGRAMRHFIKSNAGVGGGAVGETASTEENVQSSPTEGGGLQTISTEGHVGFTEQEYEEEDDLKTAGVIILSNGRPNWSMRQFIKSNVHVVDSIILQFLSLHSARDDAEVSKELTAGVTIEACESSSHRCNCIVFWTVKQITSMLDRGMPGTLKPLTDSLCLLPCSACLTNGCHGCNRESLLREGQNVVSGILEDKDIYTRTSRRICICIPVKDAGEDNWTKLLVRSLRSKDAEGRGVRNMATEALEGYLGGGRGSEEGSVEYDIFSFVVPRLTEILINLVLTLWFKVDGFSSALVARRTVRDHLVDSKSSGFAANAFLTKAVVKSNDDNSQVCQVLTFRGRDWLCITTFISVGCVNVICALVWCLLISYERGHDTSQPPSLPSVAVIIAAIASPWLVATVAMASLWNRRLNNMKDSKHRSCVVRCLLFLYRNIVPPFVRRVLGFLVSLVKVFVLVSVILVVMVISPVLWPGLLLVGQLKERRNEPYASPLIATGLLFEMACFVSWSARAGALGIKGFGRWLYAVLQILIWVKWAMGSYLLNRENSSEFFGKIPYRYYLIFYSSAFWLNAVLAGVRCKWGAWPWKHNHLF